jgi:hypothetical protein
MAIEPGPQFDGNNFDPKDFGFEPGEAEDMEKRAVADYKQSRAEALYKSLEMGLTGEEGGFEIANQTHALGKMHNIPAHMYREDEDGNPEAFHTEGGWTSTWGGGMYIDHSHPVHGTVDVTNLRDYSRPDDELPNLTGDELIQHHRNFLKYKDENFPKDMR